MPDEDVLKLLITEVLKEAKRPLTKKEIMDRVKKKCLEKAKPHGEA